MSPIIPTWSARATDRQGSQRIDILVNNAGIAGPNVKTWDYPLDAGGPCSVNLDGPFPLPCAGSFDDRPELRPHRQYCVHRRRK
jgi:NAD(P)-dependent dehydrogenase (short-subunit alcohol dehydrogenase family)